jgi:hypothetical protein
MKKILLFIISFFVLSLCKHDVKHRIEFTGLDHIIHTLKPELYTSLFFINNLQNVADSLQQEAAMYQIHAIKLYQILHLTATAKIRQTALVNAIKDTEKAKQIIKHALVKSFTVNKARFSLYLENLNTVMPNNDSLLRLNASSNKRQALVIFDTLPLKVDANNETLQTLSEIVQQQQESINLLIRAYGICLNFSKTGLQIELERNRCNLQYRIIAKTSQTPIRHEILKQQFPKDSFVYHVVDQNRNFYLTGSFNSFQEAQNYCQKNRLDDSIIQADIGSLMIDLNCNNNGNGSHIYRIQIHAIKEPISDQEYKVLEKIHPVIKIEKIKGMYKYFLGDFQSYDEAVNFKLNKALNNGFVVVDKVK